MRRQCKDIKLTSYESLIGWESELESGENKVLNVPLTDLYPFRNHPFQVKDDEKMRETTESIRQYGVLLPGIVRPRPEGGYELISGHRRKRGCELAGKSEMPVISRNYTDDEAIILMVDSNIQRENILPSEKAKSYKMKCEALKHQGIQTGNTTLGEMAEVSGEHPKAVQRYIWLANLCDELLLLVDEKKLGFVQGVNISFLSPEEQAWVHTIIREFDCDVSVWKSNYLKEHSKKGELTYEKTVAILRAAKGKKRSLVLKDEQLRPFFDGYYSNDEMIAVIMKLLEQWKLTQR